MEPPKSPISSEQVLARISEIHAVHLEILKEIIRISEKHGIPFTLNSGSLLGAVRHKGPIPWDDDLDIAFLSEDYERFLEVCRDELDCRFFLQTRETDPESPHHFAKIRANNTVFPQLNHASKDMHHGIFVDLFPFERVPQSIILQRIHKAGLRFGFLLEALRSSSAPITSFKRLIRAVVRLVALGLPKRVIESYFQVLFTAFNESSSGMVTLLRLSGEYDACLIPENDLKEIIKVEYAGLEAPIPAKFHTHLVQLYGDYKSLPAEEERYPKHHALKLEVEFEFQLP